jgi:hypothetical protein
MGKAETELARRAIAAAERRRALEAAGDDAAERLRAAVDSDGRLTPEAALAALSEQERHWNPFADPDHLERESAKQDAARQHLFGPEPDDDEPPSTPTGDVDAGAGTVPEPRFEYVQTDAGMELMEVFELTDDERKSTDD